MSSYGRSYDDSRRYGSSSRRDRSPPRRDRRSSPGPSRARSPAPPPRNDKELPEQFGRVPDDRKDDDFTVLQRMKKSYNSTPLGSILKCIDGSRKLKVWTRNFKEVRGICTGYVTAFDKHWNLVMTDVDEVFLKPRKAKTPFLSDLKSSEPLPELEPKVPRQKKDPAVVAAAAAAAAAEKEKETPAPEKTSEGAEGATDKKKKKKRKKNKGPTTEKRHIKQFFVRGDNIVMVAVMEEEDDVVSIKEEEGS